MLSASIWKFLLDGLPHLEQEVLQGSLFCGEVGRLRWQDVRVALFLGTVFGIVRVVSVNESCYG